MNKPILVQIRPTHETHGTTKFLLVEFWTEWKDGLDYEKGSSFMTSIAWNKRSIRFPDRGPRWQGAFDDPRFNPMHRYLVDALVGGGNMAALADSRLLLDGELWP